MLAGCASTPELRALEQEVAELKRAQVAGATGSEPRERLAELGAEMARLSEQVARVEGQLEEALHLAQRALEEAEAARRAGSTGGAAAQPLVRGGSAPPAGSPPRASASRTPAPAPRAGLPAGVSAAEVQAYESAFRQYRAGDYRSAIGGFQSFLEAHPSSDYADNALFWTGECYQKLGDFELAAVTFDKVHKQFPKGNKAPDALYRQAVALLAVGDQKGERPAYEAAAGQLFERLLREYPSSDRSAEAQRQLEKLGR